MTATLHTLPTQKHIADAYERIEAVRKIALGVWDERDEETNQRRDLHAFEALFLSAFDAIQKNHAKVRRDARRTWGEDSAAYDALRNLSYRQEADDLEAALQSFKLARDDFYNADLDAVAVQMAAE